MKVNIEKTDLDLIRDLCKKSQVKSLFAFGSVTRSDYNASSDIDMVVDFNENDPFKYAELYFTLKAKLEAILKRQVDLLEARAIRNRLFKKHLEETRVEIYGH